MFRAVCREAPAVIEHLLAKLLHGAAMLMPAHRQRLITERAAALDGAGHDVEIPAAARDRADVQRIIEATEMLDHRTPQRHVYTRAEPAGAEWIKSIPRPGAIDARLKSLSHAAVALEIF